MSEEKTLDTLHNAVSELRKTVDETKDIGKENSELKTKMDKINSDLDKFEAKNQEFLKKQAEKEKKELEMQDTIKEMESKLAKMNADSTLGPESKKLALQAEIKSLYGFCEKGSNPELDKKYLRSDSNVEGGFIMREANDDMILKPITETSELRPYCRIKRTDALIMNGATRESLVQGYWVGEGAPVTKSNSTYGKPKIPVHKHVLETQITTEALVGGQWDMETEIMGDFAERRGEMEGAAFVSGTGVSQPSGIVTKLVAAGQTEDSGSATTYDFDALVLLTGELKKGYNPMFGMNRKELAFIRTLKDDAGGYAWQPGNMQAGVASQLAGYNYVVLPDMADRAANAYPIIFADFRKLYTIVDAFQAFLLRNPYRTTGFTDFSLQTFVGGDVMMDEAGILLKCSA